MELEWSIPTPLEFERFRKQTNIKNTINCVSLISKNRLKELKQIIKAIVIRRDSLPLQNIFYSHGSEAAKFRPVN